MKLNTDGIRLDLIYRNPVHPEIKASLYPGQIRLALSQGYRFIRYDEVDQYEKFVILRHDIDLDLELAARMAEIEHSLDVTSTYFIMLHNNLYNPGSHSNRKVLRKIKSLGHTIGLHFDPTVWRPYSAEQLIRRIHHEVMWLSDLAEARVHWVSFHQPDPEFLRADYKDDRFESVYNSRFTKQMRYIADSMGLWREEPISELFRSGKTSKIHYLSHPLYWFFEEATLLNERLHKVLEQQQKRLQFHFADAINKAERKIILYEPSFAGK